MSTETFHQERLRGIGGSDVDAVLSLPPYGCARQLWYEKTGVPADYPLTGGQLERGKALEPLILEMFRKKTGFLVQRDEDVYVHPVHEFMLVHVDGLVAEEHGSDVGVIEVKDMSPEVFRSIKRNGISLAYALQVQHGIFCAELPYGYFVAHCCEKWGEIEYFRIEADLDLQAMVLEKCREFWKMVQDRVMPDALPARDPRCKKCTHRVVCRGLEDDPDEDRATVVADESMTDLVQELLEAQRMKKDAEAFYEIVASQVEESLGKRTAVKCAPGTVYFRPQERRTEFDARAVKAMRPNLEKAVRDIRNMWVGYDDPKDYPPAVQSLIGIVNAIYTPQVSQSRPLRAYPARRTS